MPRVVPESSASAAPLRGRCSVRWSLSCGHGIVAVRLEIGATTRTRKPPTGQRVGGLAQFCAMLKRASRLDDVGRRTCSRRMIVPPLGAVYRDDGENRLAGMRNSAVRARMFGFVMRPSVEDLPRLSVLADRLRRPRRIAQACREARPRSGRRHAGGGVEDLRGRRDRAGHRGRPARVRREPGAGGQGEMAGPPGTASRHRAASDRPAAIQQGQGGGGAVRRHPLGRPARACARRSPRRSRSRAGSRCCSSRSIPAAEPQKAGVLPEERRCFPARLPRRPTG